MNVSMFNSNMTFKKKKFEIYFKGPPPLIFCTEIEKRLHCHGAMAVPLRRIDGLSHISQSALLWAPPIIPLNQTQPFISPYIYKMYKLLWLKSIFLKRTNNWKREMIFQTFIFEQHHHPWKISFPIWQSLSLYLYIFSNSHPPMW